VVGGCASNHPPQPTNSINICHSERSEESCAFSRTVVKLFVVTGKLFIATGKVFTLSGIPITNLHV
jgi:hypothetical protein